MQETIRGFRLSHGQRRLWLAGCGGEAAFHARCVIEIEGNADSARLKAAFGQVIDSHESLRTVFRARAGMAVPIQVVEPPGCRPAWQDLDLTDLAAGERSGRLERLLRLQGEEPFDLEQAPLLRATWVRLEPRRQVLLLTLPTLIADSRSLAILTADLASAYAQQGAGSATAGDDIAQYVQFSEWEHEVLADAEERQAYWARQGLEAPKPLRLPFQRASTEPAAAELGRVELTVEPGRVAALEAVAASLQSTVEVLLLACFKILLWRTTGRERIVVASVADGRGFEELEGAVGLFARALPISLSLNRRDRFEVLVKTLHQALEEAREWQDVSLSGEAAEVTLSQASAFGFEWAHRPEVSEADGLRFALQEHRASFDRPVLKVRALVDAASGKDRSLSLELQFDANAFDESDMERWVDQLATLVASATCEPRAAIEDLPLVAEPGELLTAFDGSDRRSSDHRSSDRRGSDPVGRAPKVESTTEESAEDSATTVHQLFEAQVARVPERVAVRYESEELRFAELDARANALARFLRSQGVGPEVPVPLVLDRSLDMVVALLGVLKAGGFFVPLIPNLPRERLAAMLAQLDAPVILAHSGLGEGLPEHSGRRVWMDTDWAEIARAADDIPLPLTDAGNLAYMVFTSGTTGRPKGVMIEHRQVLSYLTAIRGRLDLPEAAEFAMVSTFAADLGYTMLFPALTTGGTLNVISQDRASDPAALAETFEQHAIDCLKITPGHLDALFGPSRSERLLPRRRLILGGEALQPTRVAELREAAPECEIFNHYGPTETTIGAATFHLPAGRSGGWAGDERRRTVPIGRPLANTRIYLVDTLLRPVPAWVSGEILIGGTGLCRGYLSRPARTAESLIPDPWSGVPGSRLYRTGDLARHADGELEFLGRRDHQVKFHGFRVELEEIRAALNRDSRVRENIVRRMEDAQGHAALVVTYAARQELPVSELREILSRSIPDEILPNVFIHLPKLPYTPNGKIDIAALPSLEEGRERQKKRFVAPRDPVEERLAEIWATVLGLERVGVHDNYFEIGGDSIQSIRVIARAGKVGIRLTAPQFFEHQTVAELASAAEVGSAIPVDLAPATGEVPLTPIQRRFFEQDHPESQHWNLSLRLEVQAGAKVRGLAEAFSHLIEQHDALRLRFTCDEDGAWRQHYAATAPRADFEVLDFSSAARDGESQDRESAMAAAVADREAGLNLGGGPVARAVCLIQGADRPLRLHLIFHHLVVDGVSWRILLEDFETAYQNLCRERRPEPAARTSSFKAWAEALVELAEDSKVRDEMTRWLAQSRRPVAPLPLDFSGGSNTEGSARTVITSLAPDETRDLLQEAPKRYRAQVEEILLLALAQALADWTGRQSFLIDLEGHGREDIVGDLDVSRTVGWFTSVSPLYLDLDRGLDEGGDFSTRLKVVKEQRRAVPGRGLAYGLMRYLSEDSAMRGPLRELPRAEVGFNYMGQLDGLVSEPFSLAVGAENLVNQRSAGAPRLHLVALNSWVSEGCLHLGLSYSESFHRRETVTALGEDVVRQLRAMLSGEESAVTDSPADFPLAGLDEEEFQKVAGLLSALEESK